MIRRWGTATGLAISTALAISGSGWAQTPLSSRELDALKERARSDSNDGSHHYRLGLGYWSRRQYDAADSALRVAVRLNPRDAEANLALHFLPYARNPELDRERTRPRRSESSRRVIEETDRFYTTAFRLNPLVDLRILSYAYQEPRYYDYTSAAGRFYLRYFAGFTDLGAGRYTDAYDRLKRLAVEVFDEQGSPDSVPAFVLWYRALAAAHSGMYDSAIVDLERLLGRAVQAENKSAVVRVPIQTNGYRFTLAVVNYRAGHHDRAIELLRDALTADLGLYMAHVYLATILEERHLEAEALHERELAVQAHPDDAILQEELGLALYNLGRDAEAAPPLLRAIELNPRAALPHFVLGHSALALGRKSEGRDHFTRFLELAPHRLREYIADARGRLDSLPPP